MTLTQYGLMAEQHWRQFLPKMVRESEAKGIPHTMLFEAQEKAKDEMVELIREFQLQGLTPEQAQQRAVGTGAGEIRFSCSPPRPPIPRAAESVRNEANFGVDR